MTDFLFYYGLTVFVLLLFHKGQNQDLPRFLQGTRLHLYFQRLQQRTPPESKSNLLADVIVAAIGFAIMCYYTNYATPPANRDDIDIFVPPALGCVVFCVVVILSLGGTIAVNPKWNRSYPLIAVYASCTILIFTKLYVVLGVVDSGHATGDYYTCLI